MNPNEPLSGDDLFLRAALDRQLKEAEEQLGALAALVNNAGWKLFQTAMKQLSEAAYTKAEQAPTPHQMATRLGNARALALAASWPEQMIEHLREQLGVDAQRQTR